jgi:hypothetical protein
MTQFFERIHPLPSGGRRCAFPPYAPRADAKTPVIPAKAGIQARRAEKAEGRLPPDVMTQFFERIHPLPSGGRRCAFPSYAPRADAKTPVIPAKAGIQCVFSSRRAANQKMAAPGVGKYGRRARFWIPAFAGMTGLE